MRGTTRDRAGVGEAAGRWIVGIACAGLLGALLVCYVVCGQDAHFIVHDQFDCDVTDLVMLARSGKAFVPTGRIEQVANGLPRACLPAAMKLTTLSYLFLPPFPAFLTVFVTGRLVAFVGTWLLVRNHLSPPGAGWLMAPGIALGFAVLPHYSHYGLSILGQPLLLYSILNLYKHRQHWWDYVVVVVFAFGCSLVFAGMFIWVILALWTVLASVRRRRLHGPLCLATVLLGLGAIVSEYEMIAAVAGRWFVPHRVEREPQAVSLWHGLRVAAHHFVYGHYHAPSANRFILLLAVPAGLVAGWIQRRTRTLWLIMVLLAACAFTSLLYGLYDWGPFTGLRGRIPGLNVVNLSRFYWLTPSLWHVLLAVSLGSVYYLSRVSTHRRKVLLLCVIAVCLAAHLAAALRSNVSALATLSVATGRQPCSSDVHASFRRFYARDLFRRIRADIAAAPSTYRVISVGLHPSIAQFNGFYTLDMYEGLYPLSYKHAFREIIAPELERSPEARRYFDHWGNRCYVLSDRLSTPVGQLIPSESAEPVALHLNMHALWDMGGRFVLSAVPIQNADSLGLSLRGVYEGDSSMWRVHLYQVERPATSGASQSGWSIGGSCRWDGRS